MAEGLKAAAHRGRKERWHVAPAGVGETSENCKFSLNQMHFAALCKNTDGSVNKKSAGREKKKPSSKT